MFGGELARGGMQATVWGVPGSEAVAQPAGHVPYRVAVRMLAPVWKVLLAYSTSAGVHPAAQYGLAINRRCRAVRRRRTGLRRRSADSSSP